jgi:PAS domain-containing protein
MKKKIPRRSRRSPRTRPALSEPMIRKVLDAPEARLVIDRDSRIVLVNAAAEKLFGRVWSELARQPLDLLLPQLKSALQRRPHSPQVTAEIAALELRQAMGAEVRVQVLQHTMPGRSAGGHPDLRIFSVRPIAAA